MKRFMVYTKHSRINISSLSEVLKENSNNILMFILFVCGLIIGTALSFFLKAELKVLCSLLNNVIYNYSNVRFFLSLLSMSLAWLLLCICSGLSCVGYPFVCLWAALRGALDGIIAGYLLTSDGIKGLMLFLLIIIPGEMIFISAYVLLCGFFAKTASALAVHTFFGTKEEIAFRENSGKIIILSLTALSSALISVISRMFFLNLFK